MGQRLPVVSALCSDAELKNLHKLHPAHQYRSQWDAMAVKDVFLTFHNRLIVPEAVRAKVLSTLHIQHTGKTKTLMDARQLYFWPGMTNDIKLMVSRCEVSTTYLPSQALESQIATAATLPFQQFSIHLGKQKGKDYLIGVDRYSGWTMVAHLPKTDTKTVTKVLEDQFIDHGIPVSILTDGGPQFWEPFKVWCAMHHISPELSSAYHLESNGHGECAVGEMKKLLGKMSSFTAFR